MPSACSSLEPTLICSACGTEKPALTEYFHKDKNKPFGLSSACKECAKARSRKWHAENPEKARENARRYRQNNADYERERIKKWVMNNREKALAHWAKRRSEKREEINASMREWSKANRDRVRVWSRKARARRANSIGNHTREDIATLYNEQAGRCAACCNDLEKYEVDHIKPIALGGSNYKYNLQLLCVTCNRSKGALHPAAWVQKIMECQS